MNLSEKIKKARIEKNLTQETLAKKINVSRKTLSAWENDRSNPDIESIKSISNILDKDISYFIGSDINDKKNKINVYLNISNVILVFINLINLTLPFTIRGLTIIDISMIILLLISNKKYNNKAKNKLVYKKCIIISIFILLFIFETHHLLVVINEISAEGILAVIIKTIIVITNISLVINYLERINL
ncbi:helix-turn-helix domain-containing protein [Fructilactobacillus frigidiflavus]|uniref:helix-turn-helix domain-containing protein n=1 Tax=Fructilactobacillus frigidiflavus TaxID=3242688 RepID=UPI0037578860